MSLLETKFEGAGRRHYEGNGEKEARCIASTHSELCSVSATTGDELILRKRRCRDSTIRKETKTETRR